MNQAEFIENMQDQYPRLYDAIKLKARREAMILTAHYVGL